jgi:hypothetical protein
MKKTTVRQEKPPSPHDWRTTDEDEIERRRYRARTEPMRIRNLDPKHPIYSNFEVKSASGLSYTVEIRSISQRLFSCNCVDFRINALGTCKHVEATLLHIEARHRRLFREAQKNGAGRIDVIPDLVSGSLRVEGAIEKLPRRIRGMLDGERRLVPADLEPAVNFMRDADIPGLRISQDVGPWLEARRRDRERLLSRKEYERKVHAGEWPPHETLLPLYPYQREGMLHLAFTERALLADEMGLGKTIQAIAACSLLHRLGKAARVVVVAPASLKTEWEDQIQRFTQLPYQLVFGPRQKRLKQYVDPPFFTVVNYEQMLADALDVNARLQPDVVILDEAQRIKNWGTKTAQAVKRLRSRYAFILTGTPIENRIDEIHSLMSFLDPSVLGPLFRFNREFYQLDDRGRPSGYRNLDQLHERIAPFLLRRRKADVETELPDRTDTTYFVPLSPEQRNRYAEHEANVARLASIAQRRPLTQQESDKLLRELNMMRMTCDTNYILDPKERACPKLGELAKILEECRENRDVKVLIFSEWVRMLELVRELCDRLGMGYALHTGSVPQRRRRAEIQLFKSDPNCRVFLSSESGGTGLNLQNASVVINCDMPWNPAKLEQRIARAWRKHQTRPVTVINLVSERTIEHRMLATLSAKQQLADGVLDLRGDLKDVKLTSGRQAFVARLQQVLAQSLSEPGPVPPKPLPVDRALAFGEAAKQKAGAALVRCEERYPLEGSHSVVLAVVDGDAGVWQEKLAPVHEELFGNGRSDPLAPVKLEVIDRATFDAVERLMAAGLIAPSIRAIRELFPGAEQPRGQLSEADRLKAQGHRQQAGRKLKMARLLAAGGLVEEEREALLHSASWLARALAVENQIQEPAELSESLRAPGSLFWGQAAAALKEYLTDASAPSGPVADAIQTLLGGIPS